MKKLTMNQAAHAPQTLRVASKYCVYSHSHLRNLCSMGMLPRSYKSGHIWLVYLDEVLAYQASDPEVRS
jgi:hypothetical protein